MEVLHGVCVESLRKQPIYRHASVHYSTGRREPLPMHRLSGTQQQAPAISVVASFSFLEGGEGALAIFTVSDPSVSGTLKTNATVLSHEEKLNSPCTSVLE